MRPTIRAFKTHLTIIGSDGAVGLPASYLASVHPIAITTISSQPSALASSTHTVHTSLVRPNCAVWPFRKAFDSWLNNGPLDIKISPRTLGFGLHYLLQSYCVTDEHVTKTWEALRRLAWESRKIYMEFDREFGGIRIGESGRGHLASPFTFMEDDKEAVLALKDKLGALGVESDLLTSAKEIQDYVGPLRIRRPELMVRYPEDFVLDLNRYRTSLVQRVAANGGDHIQDTVTGLERDPGGKITAVITSSGRRIHTDMVFYAGGWRASQFMKECLGISLSSHLAVASGVRFQLPNHLVNRSTICGSMFLAPGHDMMGHPVTDVGQMFLVNFKDQYPREKHRVQALKRFHSHFDYRGDITKIWNCVGRPITTNGLPFLERVAPNMVVALGGGMFGVTTGAALARRGLDLLLKNEKHPDRDNFTRQSAWNIASTFLRDKMSSQKTATRGGDVPESSPAPGSSASDSPSHLLHPGNPPHIVQLGERGAMTAVLAANLATTYPHTVYPSRSTAAAISDISAHPHSILLVATHGSLTKLPAHYGMHYISAESAIEAIISAPETQHLAGILAVSGGTSKPWIDDLAQRAKARGISLIYFPTLATSLIVLLKAVRVLLWAGIGKQGTSVTIEDRFHAGKKEVPSAGHSQLIVAMIERFGEDGMAVLVEEKQALEDLKSQHPRMAVDILTAGRADGDADAVLETARHRFPGLVPVASRSVRAGDAYCCVHRFTLRESGLVVTLEQSLMDRTQFLPPLHYAIEKLAQRPPPFSALEAGAVVPVIDFPRAAAPSLTAGVRTIIQGLKAAGKITRVEVRGAPQLSSLVQLLLTDEAGEMLALQHVPELACSLRVVAQIDGQDLSISVSGDI